MRNPQYLVVYKDSNRAKQRFFGPFVNIEIADKFKDHLPTPLDGGHKLTKSTEPQTYADASRVRSRLLDERT